MIRIRALQAVAEPETCEEYVKGHRRVLEDYGVTNVTSGIPAWLGNPNVFMVVAEDAATNMLYGGIRVQIADGILPLPIETAIGFMDPKVLDTINYYHMNGGVGELCGLWNSKAVAGQGSVCCSQGPALLLSTSSNSGHSLVSVPIIRFQCFRALAL